MKGKSMMKISLVVFGLGIIAFAVVTFFSIGDEAGQPVPTPRTVTFDSNSDETAIESGEIITIQEEQLRNAGIEVIASEEVVTTDSLGISAVGVVETDAYKDVPISPVSQSRVREIIVELGQQVKAGQTLARLESKDFTNAQAAFISARTELNSAKMSAERAVKIAGVSDEDRRIFEEARRDSQKAQALLDESTARKERSERLFKVGAVSKQNLDEETRAFLTAEAEYGEARRRAERASTLLEVNDASRSRIEEAERRLRVAEGQYSEAMRRLVIYGLSDSQVSNLKDLSGIITTYPLRAPINGEVTLRNLTKGELVEEGKTVLRVTDLSKVWVIGQFSEGEVAQIRVGTAMGVAKQAGGEVIASGRVTYISPTLNTATRTAQVRVEISNAGRNIQIGSYVRLILSAEDGKKRTVPAVPESAIQNLKGSSVVFVQRSKTDFEVRSVKVGRLSNGKLPILEGLSLGEKVVTQGSFLLRAEYLKRFD